jgi:hypothetical protein
VAGWAGWGAGPSGAGSAGGPSRPFLWLALCGAGLVTVLLLRDGKPGGALACAAAALYFALRLTGRLGPKR